MPLPIIANAYQIAQQLLEGAELHPMACVFCVIDTAPPRVDFAIATAFAAAFQSALLPPLSDGVSMGTTTVTKLDGTSESNAWSTASLGATGGDATGGTLPNSLAMGITWTTGRRGRSYRGRTYLPGVTTTFVTDPRTCTLTPTKLGALATAGANMITDLNGHSLDPAILSRKLGVATQVIGSVARVQCHQQRRRLERVAHR